VNTEQKPKRALLAVVMDLPAAAIYGDEVSNLKIAREMPVFAVSNLRNFFKRITYNYFLRDFNYASVQLVLGFLQHDITHQPTFALHRKIKGRRLDQ
jgi:hypothetical protein